MPVTEMPASVSTVTVPALPWKMANWPLPQGAFTAPLSGASGGFSGATDVSGGTLLVNGTLGGTVAVDDGAFLGGTGTLGAVSIADGGTLLGQQGETLTMGSLALSDEFNVNVALGAEDEDALALFDDLREWNDFPGLSIKLGAVVHEILMEGKRRAKGAVYWDRESGQMHSVEADVRPVAVVDGRDLLGIELEGPRRVFRFDRTNARRNRFRLDAGPTRAGPHSVAWRDRSVFYSLAQRHREDGGARRRRHENRVSRANGGRGHEVFPHPAPAGGEGGNH